VNDRLIIVFVLGTALMIGFAIFIAIMVIVHKRKQLKGKFERERMAFNFQKELLKTRLSEQEEAMRIISEEIHDNTMQLLAGGLRYLNRLPQFISEEGQQYYGKGTELLKKASSDLRNISHGLNSELISDLGLEVSIMKEVDRLNETTEIKCSFHSTGEPYEFYKGQSLVLFRIVQESLHNALKHSGADKIEVSVNYSDSFFELQIADNGKGFDMNDTEKYESLGMRNIRSRAKLLGAELKIKTSLGTGTIIYLKLPVKEGLYEQRADKNRDSR
jgi:signal transduction histidine kinase